MLRKLLKHKSIPLLFVLVLVCAIGAFGLTAYVRREGFIDGVKACDRDNDCSDGYRCNTQTCVKTHEYSVEGFDQVSSLKINGMKCNSGDECRSGTCIGAKCVERNELWKE
jgi:hypothetical protein